MDDGEQKEKRPGFLGKRAFLKLTSVTGAGLVLHEALETFGDKRREIPIEFMFGNHVLTEKHMQRIRDQNCIVLGETREHEVKRSKYDMGHVELKRYDLDSLVQGAQARGYGVPDVDLNNHDYFLDEVRAIGRVVVATDEHFSATVGVEAIEKIIESGRLKNTSGLGVLALKFLVPLVAKGVRVIQTSENSGKKPIDQAINNILALAAVDTMITAVGILGSRIPGSGEIRELIQVMGLDSMNRAMAFGGRVSKEATLAGKSFEYRNASMSLNAMIVSKTLEDNPILAARIKNLPSDGATREKELSLFFYSGNMHSFARHDFRKGEQKAEEVIGDGVLDILKYCLPIVTTAKSEEDKKVALDLWTMMMGDFSYPIPGYADFEEYQNCPELEVPDSPRLIAYKKLGKLFNKMPDNVALRAMIDRLIEEDGASHVARSELVKTMKMRADKFGMHEIDSVFGDKLMTFEGVPYVR